MSAHEQETSVRVLSIDRVADDVVSVRFGPIESAGLPTWEPGAHVDLVIDGVEERQYSLCGDPRDSNVWRIGVLRERAGRGTSRYVHERLAIGQEVVLRGPRNHFELVDSPRYLFIAGGIGITPLLPMIRSAEAAGADWSLVYGGRQLASMGFMDELAAHGDRVTIVPQDTAGPIDLDVLLLTPLPDTLVYCCGPEGLLHAVEERSALWPAHSLNIERFAPRPVDDAAPSTSFEVVLNAAAMTLVVPPELSILEVVRAAGVDVMSSCEEGICGTCETAVLGGTPDHRDSILDEEDRAENTCMMICVSRSLTSRLVLDL
ncbi:PDR/VanB family oxidoreductase [uncultured Jatrophihabitans sp.]|uniref:PDR/VanB family oxidoreductase n=1 Tax=uncultured Jatrophihabitans sp. TaxID=1610747 RepID=UPI0035CB0E0D